MKFWAQQFTDEQRKNEPPLPDNPNPYTTVREITAGEGWQTTLSLPDDGMEWWSFPLQSTIGTFRIDVLLTPRYGLYYDLMCVQEGTLNEETTAQALDVLVQLRKAKEIDECS